MCLICCMWLFLKSRVTGQSLSNWFLMLVKQTVKPCFLNFLVIFQVLRSKVHIWFQTVFSFKLLTGIMCRVLYFKQLDPANGHALSLDVSVSRNRRPHSLRTLWFCHQLVPPLCLCLFVIDGSRHLQTCAHWFRFSQMFLMKLSSYLKSFCVRTGGSREHH